MANNGELPEFSMRGPFGGIQSEVSPEAIEGLGFDDCENMLFRQGKMEVRPRFNFDTVPATTAYMRIMDLVGKIEDQNWFMNVIQLRPAGSPPDPLVGLGDFYTAGGNRMQVAFTPSAMFVFNNFAWGLPIGYFTDPSDVSFRFSTAVVGQKLCFSQGVDPVRYWDGTSNTLGVPDVRVPARYLTEVANHLMLGNTIEGGSHCYQRIRWSAAGDPSDFTSVTAGQADMFNDLGPINGLLKLYQQAFIFQQLGIVQAIPTGIGTKPFDFIPLSAHSKGLTCPNSLAAFGETQGYYVGKDNLYKFDGTMSEPIGDMPLEGRRRIGARSRILGDIMQSKPESILGLVTTSVNGHPFHAYWVIIPGISIWVFNTDEMNWTRWSIDDTASIAGTFTTQSAVRIIDLIGLVKDQRWTPIGLTNNNPFDSVVVGMTNGKIGLFDFTGLCEHDAFVETGQLACGDYRHERQVVKIRAITQDSGKTTYKLTLTNEKGQKWDRKVTVGKSTGKSRADIYEPNLPGTYHILRIDVPKNNRFSCSELALVYSPGGELRTVVNAASPQSGDVSIW